MGTLFYGTGDAPVTIPDRLLAHLKVVMTTKLRRNESFTVSWIDSATDGGRTTLWMQPSIPMRFVFDAPDPEALNPATLKEMATHASSSAGLSVDLGVEIPDTAERAVAAA